MQILTYTRLKRARITEIFASFRKSGLWNTMEVSDFRPEVQRWPFCACTMKNMQYNHYLSMKNVAFLLTTNYNF